MFKISIFQGNNKNYKNKNQNNCYEINKSIYE